MKKECVRKEAVILVVELTAIVMLHHNRREDSGIILLGKFSWLKIKYKIKDNYTKLYSRPSVARTLIARLPRLFRTWF